LGPPSHSVGFLAVPLSWSSCLLADLGSVPWASVDSQWSRSRARTPRATSVAVQSSSGSGSPPNAQASQFNQRHLSSSSRANLRITPAWSRASRRIGFVTSEPRRQINRDLVVTDRRLQTALYPGSANSLQASATWARTSPRGSDPKRDHDARSRRARPGQECRPPPARPASSRSGDRVWSRPAEETYSTLSVLYPASSKNTITRSRSYPTTVPSPKVG
jgi:ribosomal protein L31E